VRQAIGKHLGDFLAILALFVIGVGVGAYILAQQRLRFPFVEEKPFVLKAEFSDAQAVQPGQGQTVRVAGVEIGKIGQVELEDGRAIVEMELEKKYDDLIREDATALLRPKTGLKDMFIEVDPGEGQALKEEERIPVENTAPDVDPDEFLSALDSDPRDYLKLMEGGKR
jgi:phospholipid/cholesterol/gamma-HCH transport system substrate-binding protein